jgi:hypothetical protein
MSRRMTRTDLIGIAILFVLLLVAHHFGWVRGTAVVE